MGNEMGNNSVTGQQASEESVKSFDKTADCMDCSPGFKNTHDKEKGASKDVDMSELLKDPFSSNDGDEQMASDRKNSSTKNGDLDEENRDSLQDHTSTQDDGQNSNSPTEQGDETYNDKEIGTTNNSTETIIPVITTTGDMTSNKDISTSDEKFKQFAHETTEKSEWGTVAHPNVFLEENIEEPSEETEESCSHEVEVVDGKLVGENTVENLEQGHTGVSTVEGTPSSTEGETASSTKSIILNYLDAEIKEVVTEDDLRERSNSSDVQLEDDTDRETSKNENSQIPEEKEETCEISTSTTVEKTVTGSEEVLEEDKKIHGSENQEEETRTYSASGVLDLGEVVSSFQSSSADPTAANGKVFQKNNNSIAAAQRISESASATVERDEKGRTDTTEQEGIVDKAVVVKNLPDYFGGDKNSDGIIGKDFTGLDLPLPDHVPILNEAKVQEVSVVELLAPIIASSPALNSVEDFIKKGDIKSGSSDSNEGIITSIYEAKTTETQIIMDSLQYDHPRQIVLEEPEVVKFENIETFNTCMQSVEYSSTTGLIFPNGSNNETKGACATATCFTFESNQEKVTVTVGFTTESKQKKISTNADKTSEGQCLLQALTLGRDDGEDTPLLQSAENINPSSYSTEQHSKEMEDIPKTEITWMQAQDEAKEESEKSPLLSPREPSEGDFRAPNHSARNKKPLHSLMADDMVGIWSPLKEHQQVPQNSTMVSSPRIKEKQKRSSLFASCICCTTGMN